ncbi:MAG TPA: hypothetical protein VGH89_29005 [Pseudonocardia sp.]|jgi:hypothetical protein
MIVVTLPGIAEDERYPTGVDMGVVEGVLAVVDANKKLVGTYNRGEWVKARVIYKPDPGLN